MKIELNIDSKTLKELLKYSSAETEETAIFIAIDYYLKAKHSQELDDFIRSYEDLETALMEYNKNKNKKDL
ncbi:MAG: hypothetical protein D6734_00975 [Candidatus Schekmanbacteria bacterium]|nr:MAG: hypothetical protein D6734_00975 [Candidatus Schekmanbacteria bacterium]